MRERGLMILFCKLVASSVQTEMARPPNQSKPAPQHAPQSQWTPAVSARPDLAVALVELSNPRANRAAFPRRHPVP
nr:unnamed protein product [Digitaria exilis]